ncbi:MAG TPA: hypothetical protein VEF34_19250, partial [Syntrophobacteraceae bacterium]|nr:hypothetical protein [Syntrophobacteraceae bacterium]
MDNAFLVAVGKVLRAHGVRGALKLLAYGETLGEMKSGEKLVSCEGGAHRELTIKSLGSKAAAPHLRAGIEAIARFEEIGNREQAEALTGKDL